jgi:cysteine-rich repeat protein
VWVNAFPAAADGVEGAVDEFSAANAAAGAGVATVDVYCAACVDEAGVARTGLVASVTQGAAPQPPLPEETGLYFWWRVGDFVADGAPGRVLWRPCVADCYRAESASPVEWRQVGVLSRNASFQGGGAGGAVDARVRVWENAADCGPDTAPGAAMACGAPVTNSTVPAGELLQLRPGAYVATVEASGFVAGTRLLSVGATDENVTFFLLPRDLGGQQHAVLSWPVQQPEHLLPDLDLAVVPLLPGTPLGAFVDGEFFGEFVDSFELAWARGAIELAKLHDDFEGLYESAPGVFEGRGAETALFSGLQEGHFEVWVNTIPGEDDVDISDNRFAPSVAGAGGAGFATVDVYCAACGAGAGRLAGFVTAETQAALPQPPFPGDAEDVEYTWWRAGKWVAGGAQGEPLLVWEGCRQDCYRSEELSPVVWHNVTVSVADAVCGGPPAACLVAAARFSVYYDWLGCGGGAAPGDAPSCGMLVVRGDAGGAVPLRAGRYVVVAEAGGFDTALEAFEVGGLPRSVVVLTRPALLVGDRRVVLWWPYSRALADLDLYVIPSAEGRQTGEYVWFDQPEWFGGGANVSLERDTWNDKYEDGEHGPESVRLHGVDAWGGAESWAEFEVWVHAYGTGNEGAVDEFSQSVAGALGAGYARLDVYCAGCEAPDGGGGGVVSGLLASTEQGRPPQPPLPDAPGFYWWRAGSFVRPPGARAAWAACTADCYRSAEASPIVWRPLAVNISDETCPGAPYACLLPARVSVYGNATGCTPASSPAAPSSCGRLVLSGEALSGEALQLRAGAYGYVAGLAGFAWLSGLLEVPRAVGAAGVTLSGATLPLLRAGEARVVLRWPISGALPDLDLYAVPFPAGSEPKAACGRERDAWSLPDGASALRLEREDHTGKYVAGWHGAESLSLRALVDGEYQLWVRVFRAAGAGAGAQNAFSAEVAATAGRARLEVYCDACAVDGGAERSWHAATVGQGEGLQPPLPPAAGAGGEEMVWWRAGSFVAAGGALRWETCADGCYRAPDDSPVSWQGVYASAVALDCNGDAAACALPAQYVLHENTAGCDPATAPGNISACGRLVSRGAAAAPGLPVDRVRAGSYILSLAAAGYAPVVEPFEVAGAPVVLLPHILVPELGPAEERLVLSWPVSAVLPDLDLYVIPDLPWQRDQSFVWRERTVWNASGSRIEHQRSDRNGLWAPGTHGPETVHIAGLDHGALQVWVHAAPSRADGALNFFSYGAGVQGGLATVALHCSGCLDSQGVARTGLAMEVSQEGEGQPPLPADAAVTFEWWHVGDIVAPAPGSRLQFKVCTQDCYKRNADFCFRRGCPANERCTDGFACHCMPGTFRDTVSGECLPRCGDGALAASEECEDGNSDSGDGCTADCRVETGWSCDGTDAYGQTVCKSRCGDGLLAGNEGCDDGGRRGGDGCSASCEVEPGWSCVVLPGAARSRCVPAMACGKVTQQVNPDLSVGFSWGYASAGVDPAAFDGELQVAVEMHFERMRCNPDMLVRDMSFVVPATHLGSSSSALIERAMLTQTSSVLSGKAFTVSLSLKGADWGDGAGPSCHLTKLLNFTYTPSPVLNVRPADVPLGSAAALCVAWDAPKTLGAQPAAQPPSRPAAQPPSRPAAACGASASALPL